jgi:hypothetical protein
MGRSGNVRLMTGWVQPCNSIYIISGDQNSYCCYDNHTWCKRVGRRASMNSLGTLVKEGQRLWPSAPSPKGRPGMPPKPIP